MNQSPEIFTDVFERITDAVVALDTDWCFTYMNKKAGEIFQRNPVNMIGKHIWTEFPDGIAQSFYKAYHRAIAEQQYTHAEEYYLPNDKWFENHIYPSPDGLSILFRDITEQKKTMRALEIRENRFQALLENNPAIISLTDLSLNFIYRSPSSARITGLSQEDIKTTSAIERIHADDSPKLKTTVAEAIKSPGIPQPYLCRYRHKNGHYIWLEGTVTKLKDDSILEGIVFNSHDVTEKIELEQLLLKANRLAKIGSWHVDLLKETVYWSDITREIHEVESSFVPDLISGINFYREGPGRELITQKVNEAIELGKPFDEELEIVTVKNNIRWIRTIGETEFVDGKCVRIYGSFQDIDERKRAEEKILFEQLDKMALINSTDDFIWSVSKDLKLIAANQAFINTIKIATGIVVKAGDKILLKAFPQKLLDQWQSYYKRSLLGESFREESYSKNPTDNSYTWTETAFNPIYHNEDIIGIACYSRNITERKKAEQQIKQSEEKQKTILQSLLDNVVILNATGQIQYINHVFTRLNDEEVIGSNWLQWLHEEDQPKAKEVIGQTLSTGIFSEIQVRSIGPDKKMTWFDVKIVRMPGVSSQQVLLVATDITEQKKSDEKIRISEIRLQKAKEIGKFGYWHQDIDSDMVWASKEAMRIYGFGPHEGELQRATIAACIIDKDKVKEAALNLVEHGKEYNIDIRINPADGSPMKYISALAELEKNEKGEPLRIVGTLQDITDRKKAEEELKEKNKFIESIINASPSIIYIYDIEERKNVYTNDGIKTNLGYTDVEIKEMGNQLLPTLMHPEDFETYLIDTFPKYHGIKDKEIITNEFRMKSRSGHWKWFYCTESVFLRKSNGIPKEIFGIVTDITERKEAENEIKKYNERFQVIASATNDALWEWNFETGELWANQKHQHLYEVDVSDPVPSEKVWEQKIHPADREKVVAAKKNAFESDIKTWISEYRFETKNGFIDIYDRCYIIRNADGKAIRATGTMQDITERKKAEEELRLSENRTRRIFQSDMIGFIYWDVNGEILDANDRFLEITGYSRQDLGKNKINWSDMTPPEYQELDRTAIEDIVNTGICQPYEKEYFRKDGSRVAILIGATALEGSNFGKGVSYVLDITERIKAENKLKENENYLRTILDTEPECVKILNNKGELLSMNPAGLAMIEADNEQQVLGHRMTELVDKKHRLGFDRLCNDVFNGNSGTFEFEVTGLKGGHRWLETHAVPLKDATGKVLNLLGVTRDITERKKAEEKILNTTKELRQLTAHLQTIREEERKRIAREIHDELGQQLTAIKMDTVWIDKQIPPESVAVKNKLQNMIELLDGSHQSVRKILNELRPSALDDNGLLETLEWLGKQFTESSETPVHFTSNQTTIKLPQEAAICIFRVYQEALTNIMRYAGASKVVSSLNVISKRIVLVIEDDGKGFNTAAVQSKNSFGLLGMKERVHSLNGVFDLISLPEKGTTIVVNLPYTDTVTE